MGYKKGRFDQPTADGAVFLFEKEVQAEVVGLLTKAGIR
jgi:hypothetical protein